MAISTYDKGDTVRFSAAFTVTGVATDPSEVILKIKQPSSVISTYNYSLAEISKLSAGNYYKDVIMTQSGQLYYHFEGTGTVASVEEAYLIVRPSEFD